VNYDCYNSYTQHPQGLTASTGDHGLYRGTQPLQGLTASTGAHGLYRGSQPLQGLTASIQGLMAATRGFLATLHLGLFLCWSLTGIVSRDE
jgi:hypothetical protein